MSENHLIFYTSTNQKGRNDSLGAFTPEAKKLARYIDSKGDFALTVPIATQDVSMARRRSQVESALHGAKRDYKHVYFLCHGWKNGIQFGYKWKDGASRLVKNIIDNNPSVKTITFYCCSVASGINNFCEWVYDELSAYSFATDNQVFGHYTAGHATMNPNIKIYTGTTDYIWSKNPAKGFEQLIIGDKKEANKRMHDIKDPFRFEIPFIKMDEKVDTLEQNRCKIIFDCKNKNNCVYGSGIDCKYMNDDTTCNSSVAKVNAMTLEIKRLTGGKVRLV